VNKDGLLTVVAGTGTAGFSGDGGPASAAHLNTPAGLAIDANGDLFFADNMNHRVRKINVAGIISTVAGHGESGPDLDGGAATDAQLVNPGGLAIDDKGNIFVADVTHRVRRITPAGVINTVAGGGTGQPGFAGDGGPATAAMLAFPQGIAVDAHGTLLIADAGNRRIRKVTAAGIITTIAGDGTAGSGGDGGNALSAQLTHPAGIALDGLGNLYISDVGNDSIRRVNAAGIIDKVAGNGEAWGFAGDGGPATLARFDDPFRLAFDTAGNLYVSDAGNWASSKNHSRGHNQHDCRMRVLFE
jgi:DNA-binding beta-propeller fold protein YncE